jgi:hypothetical protein
VKARAAEQAAPTTRADAEERIATTKEVLDHARVQLTEARATFIEAERVWLDRGGKSLAERKRDASDEVSRREILERHADEAHEDALQALGRIERAERLARYDELTAKLAALPGEVERLCGPIVEAERALDAALLAVAAAVADGADAHAEAERLAGDLQLGSDFEQNVRRMTLPQARQTVQEALAAARVAEERSPVDAWIAAPPSDWRDTGTTPEQRAEVDDFRRRGQEGLDRASAIERDKRLAAEAFAAGRAAPRETDDINPDTNGATQ